MIKQYMNSFLFFALLEFSGFFDVLEEKSKQVLGQIHLSHKKINLVLIALRNLSDCKKTKPYSKNNLQNNECKGPMLIKSNS